MRFIIETHFFIIINFFSMIRFESDNQMAVTCAELVLVAPYWKALRPVTSNPVINK